MIVGLGGAIAKVCAPPVVQELAHPRLRSPLSTLYYTYIFAGSILSGVFTRESIVVFLTQELTVIVAGLYMPGNWGWRVACLMQLVGPLNVLAFIFDMPESPRVSLMTLGWYPSDYVSGWSSKADLTRPRK